jgi:hypothetical protein
MRNASGYYTLEIVTEVKKLYSTGPRTLENF